MKEEVGDGEEEGEEDAVGQVQWEREGVGGFCGGGDLVFVGFELFPGGGIEVAPANVHGWRPEEIEGVERKRSLVIF